MSSSNAKKRMQVLRPEVIRWSVVVCLLPLFFIHRIAFWLDAWLFPHLRKQQLLPPLFVVGLPRSGTTYLHRLLASQDRIFTALPLWELLLAPALCQKYMLYFLWSVDASIGAPFCRAISLVQRIVLAPMGQVHPTELCNPEEDFLGLLPFDGCFLRVLLFPFSPRSWSLALPNALSVEQRSKILKSYRGLLVRHQAFRGADLRIVSKNPSFTLWVEYLAHEFPDAQFVGLRRDPVTALGSQLSSIAPTLGVFGHQADDPRIAWKFLAMFSMFWSELESQHRDGGLILLDYEELVRDAYPMVLQILQECNVSACRLQLALLAERCEQGKSYRSSHQYCLADFGICEALVRELFAVVPQRSETWDDAVVEPPPKPIHDVVSFIGSSN
jgi:omega-hydroxy-beta-dihydromenaquinone-9 sulfotransferase